MNRADERGMGRSGGVRLRAILVVASLPVFLVATVPDVVAWLGNDPWSPTAWNGSLSFACDFVLWCGTLAFLAGIPLERTAPTAAADEAEDGEDGRLSPAADDGGWHDPGGW